MESGHWSTRYLFESLWMAFRESWDAGIDTEQSALVEPPKKGPTLWRPVHYAGATTLCGRPWPVHKTGEGEKEGTCHVIIRNFSMRTFLFHS